MLLLSNLLIGDLPDAIALMLFGLVMVLISITLRKLVGEESAGDQNEAGLEETV